MNEKLNGEANMNDYIEFTRTTALYPKERALEYLMYGLIDELGEYLESFEEPLDAKYELSDVMWYVARLFDETSTPVPKDPDHHKFVEGLDLVILASKLYGDRKKLIRDNNPNKEKQFAKDLQNLYLGILAHVHYFHGDIDEIIQINVDKLTDRKNRNVLKGDGDKR